MGFRLTVAGQDAIYLAEDVIRSVHTDISTPMDSLAKSSKMAATLWITGKLLMAEGAGAADHTVKLSKWALVPAQDADCYRDVTIEVVSAGQVYRTMHLPNAFVIDYGERFNDAAGVGEFTLILRQKVDKMAQVKIDKGGADDAENNFGEMGSAVGTGGFGDFVGTKRDSAKPQLSATVMDSRCW